MAGKHSRKFFDFKKSTYATQAESNNIEKSKTSLPLKITAIALMASLAVSAIFVGEFFISGNIQKNILRKGTQVFEQSGGNTAIEVFSAENKDIKGWLNINGANINCAVCHGKNNSYYINHNQFGKRSRYGALFLSSGDTFDRKDNDQNIVIFGNNVKDGSMFGSLKKYRNLNFYKQNPEIDLYYEDTQEKYIVFAVILVSSSENDAGEIYNPSKSHFTDETEFNDWYTETKLRSLINTTVLVEFGDAILTLVTNATDFESARLVVMAKRITEWDSSHLDVSGAKVNAKTKYPKIWYDERNLEYPY